MNVPLRSRLFAPFTVARAFQSRGDGASELQLNRPALSGLRKGSLPEIKNSTACSLLQMLPRWCRACATRWPCAEAQGRVGCRWRRRPPSGPRRERWSGVAASSGEHRVAPAAQAVVPSATLGPNPFTGTSEAVNGFLIAKPNLNFCSMRDV